MNRSNSAVFERIMSPPIFVIAKRNEVHTHKHIHAKRDREKNNRDSVLNKLFRSNELRIETIQKQIVWSRDVFTICKMHCNYIPVIIGTLC